MTRKGFRFGKADEAWGPLREIRERLPDGRLLLACGHEVGTSVMGHPGLRRRRCPICRDAKQS
jgi:hypothetical protein